MRATELERAVAQLQDQVRELQVRAQDHELRFAAIDQKLGRSSASARRRS
jgi:hypothetical protein